MKIPFSAYDFFGYLGTGFLLIAAVDFAFDNGLLLNREKVPMASALLWIVLAYIIGHVVANISSFVLEEGFVRKVLRSPEALLFVPAATSRWRFLFPGFFKPFPQQTQDRIKARAEKRKYAFEAGRAFFFHCHSIVKRDAVTLERLNSFLNLYGFCRNACMALMLCAPILLWAAAANANPFTFVPRTIDTENWGNIDRAKFLAAVASLLLALGMLYRYLKFFRLYTQEVFLTYSEFGSGNSPKKVN